MIHASWQTQAGARLVITAQGIWRAAAEALGRHRPEDACSAAGVSLRPIQRMEASDGVVQGAWSTHWSRSSTRLEESGRRTDRATTRRAAGGGRGVRLKGDTGSIRLRLQKKSRDATRRRFCRRSAAFRIAEGSHEGRGFQSIRTGAAARHLRKLFTPKARVPCCARALRPAAVPR